MKFTHDTHSDIYLHQSIAIRQQIPAKAWKPRAMKGDTWTVPGMNTLHKPLSRSEKVDDRAYVAQSLYIDIL